MRSDNILMWVGGQESLSPALVFEKWYLQGGSWHVHLDVWGRTQRWVPLVLRSISFLNAKGPRLFSREYIKPSLMAKTSANKLPTCTVQEKSSEIKDSSNFFCRGIPEIHFKRTQIGHRIYELKGPCSDGRIGIQRGKRTWLSHPASGWQEPDLKTSR